MRAAVLGADVSIYEAVPEYRQLAMSNVQANKLEDRVAVHGRFPDEWDGNSFDLLVANIGGNHGIDFSPYAAEWYASEAAAIDAVSPAYAQIDMETLREPEAAEAFRLLRTREVVRNITGLKDDQLESSLKWSFDDAARVFDGRQRKLMVTLRGINRPQRDDIQSYLSTQFGHHVVEVTRD
jgi:hypothetical protein